MASFNLSTVTDALKDVSSENSGVSFLGLAKKWETEKDGKANLLCFCSKF